MDLGIRDLRVLVTAGASGIGLATAHAFLREGARVHVCDVDESGLSPLRGAMGATVCDVSSPAAVATLFEDVQRSLGGLDALVNIAGTFRFEKVGDGALDTWDFLYRVNLRTAVAASKAALPFLLHGNAASIVNIGAMGAVKAGAGMGAYAASKAGIFRLTEALAEELKDKDITVNALLPSIIDTAPNRADMPKSDFSKWVKPEEIADVIVFLLSAHARAITGALIPVSGRV